MEENTNNFVSSSEETTVSQPSSSGISFPSAPQQPKKANGSKTLLMLGLLVVVGVVGFLIFKNSSSSTDEGLVEDQPFVTESPVQTEEPEATPTPKPVDKSKIEIEIQNGTGITGEGAYLQTQLKNLDYSDFTVGNASSQDQTSAVVTFAKDLSATVVDELTAKLKEIYKSVDVKTSSTIKTDVLIVTGLRKGATAKASATPSATTKASATPTSSAKASTTPTATP